MQGKLNISEYKKQSDVFSNSATDVTVLTNGIHRIIRKVMKLSSLNKQYAQYEIKYMKAINHPHVVRHIYHQKIEHKEIHLYMPYYLNKDLEDYLQLHDDITFQSRVRMFIDILVGLKELHSKFIIHRDLKLKNIFVDENNRCVIGDLGISTCSPVSVISRIGTVGYAAPQVYSLLQYNEKVDLWSLGIIAYQIFNKKRDNLLPFPFYSENQLKKKVMFRNDYGDVEISHDQYMRSTSKLTPCDNEIPQKIKQMISAMLENKVNKRPTWIEFYQKHYLFDYDNEKRLATFFGQYKYISQIKDILKESIEEITQTRPLIIQLCNLLNKKNINTFANKYPAIQQNILKISVVLFGLMQKAIKNYTYLIEKCIYKYVKQQKQYFKYLDRQIFDLEQKINYLLRKKGLPQIRKQKNLTCSKYINEQLEIVLNILNAIAKDQRDQLNNQQLYG